MIQEARHTVVSAWGKRLVAYENLEAHQRRTPAGPFGLLYSRLPDSAAENCSESVF